MKDLNIEVGLRLKQVRHFFNEGKKLSAEQFGHLLGESRDNIANYEMGRAGVPIRVLFELYERGINPTYIITGDGKVFADNKAGKDFQQRLKRKSIDLSLAVGISKLDYSENTELKVLKVAAGKIPKSSNKE